MESRKPLISVIMSVYNEETYIRESLQSILNQTEQDFEIIITDDCSTDNTVSCIESLNDGRIQIIRNKENQGLTKNLNQGLKLARGKYIARMDGDDICMPERFASQIRYLENHPSVMLISCQTQTFGAQNLIWRLKDGPERLKAMMLIRPVLAHPGYMMRSELITEEGFLYDETYRSAQDYNFAVRVAQIYPIGIAQEILLKYRAHAKQVSSKKSGEQFQNADRVRTMQLEKLGIELTTEEWEVYHSWVVEEKEAGLQRLLQAKELMEQFLQANKRKKVYDQKVLEKVLREMLYLWAIRTKSREVLFGAAKLCDFNPKYMKLFIGQFAAVAKSKIQTH